MNRYYIPALGSLYASLDRYTLPMLRIVLGVILIPHGCQKFFGMFGGLPFARYAQIFEGIGYKPGWFWVTLVALTELVGGLMLVFGFFTRFAALAVAISTVSMGILRGASHATSDGRRGSLLDTLCARATAEVIAPQ